MSKKAFSLIELSIVILIIGIIIAGVTQSSSLLSKSKLQSAQSMTVSSPVSGIADLALWLEPTLAKSFGGSLPDNASTVATWYDTNPQVSALSNATQTDEAKQPLFISNCINGLPCLRFDGSDDHLSSSLDIGYNVMPQLTVFAVFNFTGTNAQCVFGNEGANGWARMVMMQFSSEGHHGPSIGNAAYEVDDLAIKDTSKFFSLIWEADVNDGSKFFINGTSYGNFTEHPSLVLSPPQSYLTIGSSGETNYFPLNGNIAEFIIFSRALKDEERQSVEKYLSKKWGITTP
jgi:prepilin-type N-terminal cleavage/methylation domain-containing protein